MDQKVYTLFMGRRLKKTLRSGYRRIRQRYGLTQLDIELLQYFEEHPGAMATDAICDLDLNKGNVSTALFGLYRNGLIDGRSSDSDQRVVQYHLKEKGKKIIRETNEIQDDIMGQLMQGITKQEETALEGIAAKILANLESMK